MGARVREAGLREACVRAVDLNATGSPPTERHALGGAGGPLTSIPSVQVKREGDEQVFTRASQVRVVRDAQSGKCE